MIEEEPRINVVIEVHQKGQATFPDFEPLRMLPLFFVLRQAALAEARLEMDPLDREVEGLGCRLLHQLQPGAVTAGVPVVGPLKFHHVQVVLVDVHHERQFGNVALVQTITGDLSPGRPATQMLGPFLQAGGKQLGLLPVPLDQSAKNRGGFWSGLRVRMLVLFRCQRSGWKRRVLWRSRSRRMTGALCWWVGGGGRTAADKTPRLGTEVLVIRALDTPVEQFAAPRGALLQDRLEAGHVGDHEMGPAGESLQDMRERLVEWLKAPNFVEPFPVRRIGDDATVLPLAAQLVKCFLLEMDLFRHPGPFGVPSRQLQDLRVLIRPLDLQLDVVADLAAGLFDRFAPALRIDLRPGLTGELPLESGSPVQTDQGCLDRQRATAAERVDQRPLRIPDAQADQRGGQGFLDRGGADPFSVSALVEARSGRIDQDARLVIQQDGLNPILRPRFRERLGLVMAV